MTDDCNKDLVKQARRNVADLFPQTYHQHAIMGGDWDNGSYVKGEIERLLKKPPITSGEETDG